MLFGSIGEEGVTLLIVGSEKEERGERKRAA
jgi:hypothetical protein